MKTDKIKGYKLKDNKYLYAAKQVAGLKHNEEICSTGKIVIEPYTQRYETFKELDLLDIWFEPVYETCEYKEGDAIIILNNYWPVKEGEVYRIIKVISDSPVTYVNCTITRNKIELKVSIPISNIRKATKLEINNSLLSLAKFKYPKNVVFKTNDQFVISNGEFEIDELGIKTNHYYVYINDIWADIDLEKSELLKQALTNYPVGTRFIPAHVKNKNESYCIVTNTNFSISEEYITALTDDYKLWATNAKYGNTHFNRVVFNNGNWAKIIPSYPDIYIHNHKVEFFDNYVTIGCEKLTVKQLYHLIEKYNQEIPYLKEIIKIAQYYKL